MICTTAEESSGKELKLYQQPGTYLHGMQGLGGVEVARHSVRGMCRMVRKLPGEKLLYQTCSRQEGQPHGNSEYNQVARFQICSQSGSQKAVWASETIFCNTLEQKRHHFGSH